LLRALSFVTIVPQLLPVLPVAKAQLSDVTCLPVFSWMNNARGQNPCLVAAYLQGACTGGGFSVNQLPVGTYYGGPNLDEVNGCQCSTVTYSMVSACGVCQNRSIEAWSMWNTNCTVNTSIDIYPETIPSGTSVPAWAYLDVVTSDFFNLTLAQADVGAPESSAQGSKTSGTAPSSTSHVATATSHKKSNVGAITGGVVGGVVVLALIAALVAFFLVRKRPAKSVASPAYGYRDSAMNSPPMNQHHSMYGNPSYSENPVPRLYDPSDPSTYPQPPPTPSIHTTNPGPVSHSFHPAQPGQYSGIPEV
jgi:hypothetical protein